MIEAPARFEAAIADMDSLNARDPHLVACEETQQPAELIYARRMSECLSSLYPDASETLRLAARAQHICRWEVPRSSYPQGRAGYNAWRKACREHHAGIASHILRSRGYDEGQIAQVSKCIRKEDMKRDPDSQALENVAALVFTKHYLEAFAATHPDYDEEKLLDILRKTVRKMDAKGREALAHLPLPGGLRQYVETALRS